MEITIEEIQPPVWRQLRVPGDLSFLRLHVIIQNAFGWTNSHLHEFIVDDVHFGDPVDFKESGIDVEYYDEVTAILGRVIERPGQEFTYVYDYGDEWRHHVVVDNIDESGAGDGKPECIGGARACPPEDCGGPWGYADFLEAIKDHRHKRHEEMLEWIGEEFDAEEFDIDAVNSDLAVVRPMINHGVDWIQ